MVDRQKRQYGIQAIGVNRLKQSSTQVADVIMDYAGQLRQRNYQIAVSEAKIAGERAASNIGLNQITSIDKETGLSDAMNLTEGMGRFAKSSFENIVLRRFETAVSDDIQAKKAELMQRVSESPNAPKLFETAFKEYLSETGKNATGYYKGIIVDNGAHAMEDGLSRLKVAQIARMQEQARAAKAEHEKNFLESAYEAGAAGIELSKFFAEQTKTGAAYDDYQGIEVAEKGEFNKLKKKAATQFANGRILKIMNDPKVSIHAEKIQLYFTQGGNDAVLRGLPPSVIDEVNAIRNVAGAEGVIDYFQIAKDNTTTFNNAKVAGNIVQSEDAAFKQTLANLQQMFLEEDRTKEEARVKAQVDNAQLANASLTNDLNSGYYAGVGEHIGLLQGKRVIDRLNNTLANYDPRDIGDKYNTISNQIEDAKADYAKGLIRRGVNNLNEDQANILAAALKEKDMGTIAGLLNPAVFNQLLPLLTDKNKGGLAEIATAHASGEKVITDGTKAIQSTALKNNALVAKNMINDPDITMSGKKDALDRFIKEHSGLELIRDEYLTDLDSLQSEYRREEEKAAERVSNTSLQSTLNMTDSSSSVDVLINSLVKTFEENNQGRDKAQEAGQKVFNKFIQHKINAQLSTFGEREGSVAQMNLMAQYAREGANPESRPEGILKENAEYIESIINEKLKNKEYGYQFVADNINVAETISSLAEATGKANKQVREAMALAGFQQNVLNGRAVSNPSDEKVQIDAGKVMAQTVGYEDISPSLFTKPVDQLTQEDAKLLNLINSQPNVMPFAFKTAALSFLNGTMPPESMPEFMRNVRNFVYQETSNGSVVVRPGIYAQLGKDNAAKLEALNLALPLIPAGREGAYLQTIVEEMRVPMTDERFQKQTGTTFTPQQMILNMDIPSILMDDMIPIVKALSTVYGENTQDVLQNALDSRFAENANAYSQVTGGSYVPFDASMFVKDIGDFEKGVAAIVQERIDAGENLRFDIGSSVSIEDYRVETSMMPFQIVKDVVGNASEAIAQARVQKRVLYGPTLNSSIAFPQFQLYTIDEFGSVFPIAGSQFNLKTAQIAKAMGTLPDTPSQIATTTGPEVSMVAPKAPTGDQSQYSIPTTGKITESAIKQQLTPQQLDVINQPAPTGPSYATTPTGPIIKPDSALIKSVSNIVGPKSNAAEIIKNFGSIDDPLKMQTEITKVINATKRAPKTKGRDALLERLQEVLESVRGK